MAFRPVIGLVGPVWPYRGGIAQYTTRLKQALEAACELRTVSFRKQYPKWLYPGTSDIEPASGGRRETGVDYALTPWSPWTWWRTSGRLADSGCGHVIIAWWTLFWAPALAAIAWLLRRRGVQVVFLCHNLADHDARGLKSRLARWMLGQADGYITHSVDQAATLSSMQPGKPVLQRLHPIYDRFPAARTRLPARGRLDVLFFGFIRPYKGLKILLDAVESMQDPDLYLSVVGESWGATPEIDAARARLGDRLDVHLEYVDDETAATFFDRADVVALPYLSATGSGVVAVAYHYRKPVLASRVGGLEDAVLQARTGWLVPAGSATALAEVLRDVDREKARGLRDGIAAFADENGWDAMASAVVDFLAKMPQRRDRGTAVRHA
ncbi:MAG TPA: glycosyltransferase [Luteimonas sp.]|nr:glycosyltransferase [Luteimonas sp.]